MPCIRCGDCAQACPAELQPMDLYWFAKARQFDKARSAHLFDCIECGACSYVCPSQIPLVDYYRFAKSELWASEREHKAAERARQRHDFRQFRLVRDKAEKAARLASRTAPASTVPTVAASSTPVSSDDKRAAIEAALARAAARKAEPAAHHADSPPAAAPAASAACGNRDRSATIRRGTSAAS